MLVSILYTYNTLAMENGDRGRYLRRTVHLSWFKGNGQDFSYEAHATVESIHAKVSNFTIYIHIQPMG